MSNNTDQLDRELSLGEIFGRTYDAFKRNYVKVLPVFLAFGVFSTIVGSYISLITPSPPIPANLANLTNGELSSLANVMSKYLGYTLANYFTTWCILYFAVALGISRMNESLQQTQERPNYASLAMTTIVSVAIIEAGIFLLVIGALVFATMLYLVLVAATIEKKTTLSAIGRSKKLVSGTWAKTFFVLVGVQIAIAIIANLIGGIAGLAFNGETSTLVGVITSNFTTALLFPLISASMLVLYYSNRARREGITKRTLSPYDGLKPQPISGFPIFQNVYCSHCGSSVTSEERFCHNCGTQLQQ